MKTRKELKEAGLTDSQIDDLMEKGICLFNCKSDIERLEKERNSPKCHYCGRSIVRPSTVYVYRRSDDNIYCSDECARKDGNFCVGGVYPFEGEVYERYFANQEGLHVSIEFLESYKLKRTGNGRESDVFKYKDKFYYADLNFISTDGNECMIFKANKKGMVTDWVELFCRRGIKEINREALLSCINEFIREQENEEKHG